jgi:predicted Zn-dependent peptidase
MKKMKKALLAFALTTTSLTTLAVSFAQEPTDTPELATPLRSEVERKNRIPVSPDVLHVHIPKPVEATLSNGVRVLILENHRAPLITLQFSIDGAGSIYANTPELGTAAAALMRQGTTTRTGAQITKDLERLGATVSSTSGPTALRATLVASGLSENFDQWFALATDILLNPSFPNEEWQRLKQNRKASLQGQRTNPTYLATERFNQAVFANHPAGALLTAPQLDTLTVESFHNWHDERYVPQNTLLGIVGDFTPAEILPKLEKALGSWKKTEFGVRPPADPKPVDTRRAFLVDRPNSVETTLLIGNIGVDRRSPDYIPLVVATNIIGASPEGRLFSNLREEKGYTYGISSSISAGEFAGPWLTQTQVRTDVTENSLSEIFREMQRLSDVPVPAAELEERKRKLVARFALPLENPTSPVTNELTIKSFGFPEDYWETYPAQIMAVTAQDIQRVARKYINAEKMQIVAVGDAGKIKSVLEKYGPVEAYDINGRKLN